MNEQQLWSLLAVSAIVLIPLGVLLGSLLRALRGRIIHWLPPRHLRRAGERRRRAAGDCR